MKLIEWIKSIPEIILEKCDYDNSNSMTAMNLRAFDMYSFAISIPIETLKWSWTILITFNFQLSRDKAEETA